MVTALSGTSLELVMNHPRITLEQWAALKAVVEEGSYAKAAEALNKSQSTVSYAIQKIEEQLPVQVLRQDGRKAVLTAAGEILYRRAVEVLKMARDTEETARLLSEGWEPEITIAVDVIANIEPILWAFEALAKVSPITRVRMYETSLSGTDEMLLENRAALVITPRVPPGYMGKKLETVSMIPVVHKNHVLANKEGISENELKSFRQVVLRDSGTRRQQDVGWLGAEQRWTVSHFQTVLGIVRRGLGFAFVPRSAAKELLESGDLVVLGLEWQAERHIPVYLVPGSTTTNGPATELLMNEIVNRFSIYR